MSAKGAENKPTCTKLVLQKQKTDKFGPSFMHYIMQTLKLGLSINISLVNLKIYVRTFRHKFSSTVLAVAESTYACLILL